MVFDELVLCFGDYVCGGGFVCVYCWLEGSGG